MNKLVLFLFVFILFGCDSNVSNSKDIAKEVAENTTWPMQIEGEYEYFHSNDHGGVDQNIYGSIQSSSDSFVMIDTLDSILQKENISNGDDVIATIRPSEIDAESYQIISIRKK